jgi:hypothetical protein
MILELTPSGIPYITNAKPVQQYERLFTDYAAQVLDVLRTKKQRTQ